VREKVGAFTLLMLKLIRIPEKQNLRNRKYNPQDYHGQPEHFINPNPVNGGYRYHKIILVTNPRPYECSAPKNEEQQHQNGIYFIALAYAFLGTARKNGSKRGNSKQ
jgi:hypothetical protein